MDRTKTTLIVWSMLLLAGCTEPRETAGPVPPASIEVQSPQPAPEPNLPEEIRQADSLRDRWGIKVERASLSAGGYMVDFRYRVLDAQKAAPILDRSIKPYMVDQATGAKFIVPDPPKVGQLRSGGVIREGAVYYIFFANPAKYVKSGNKITVVVGDFQVRDVVVQ